MPDPYRSSLESLKKRVKAKSLRMLWIWFINSTNLLDASSSIKYKSDCLAFGVKVHQNRCPSQTLYWCQDTTTIKPLYSLQCESSPHKILVVLTLFTDDFFLPDRLDGVNDQPSTQARKIGSCPLLLIISGKLFQGVKNSIIRSPEQTDIQQRRAVPLVQKPPSFPPYPVEHLNNGFLRCLDRCGHHNPNSVNGVQHSSSHPSTNNSRDNITHIGRWKLAPWDILYIIIDGLIREKTK